MGAGPWLGLLPPGGAAYSWVGLGSQADTFPFYTWHHRCLALSLVTGAVTWVVDGQIRCQ